jgi:hypothetical protein
MEKDIKLFKYYKSGILKSPEGSDKKDREVSLYKLDIQPPINPWRGFELPPQFNKTLEEAVFALSSKAKSTIDYLLLEAPVQRYMPLYFGYDTSVRETLMEIGENFFEKAVFLLCDYYYDESTQYYSRNKEISCHTLQKLIIYKYWSGRGGRGLQYIKAGFDKCKYSKENLVWGPTESYYVAQQVKHYETLQERKWDAINSGRFCDFDTNKGISLDDTDKAKYSKFIVKIIYYQQEFDKRGQIIAENKANKKYLAIFLNEKDAKMAVLNEFYKLFDISDCYYETNPVILDSVEIEQIDNEKFENKSIILLGD